MTDPEMMNNSAEERVVYTSKNEIIGRLQQLCDQEEVAERAEMDLLKQVYYKLQKAEVVESYDAYVSGGGDPETYTMPVDETEAEFKTLMQQLRERRAAVAAQQELEKAQNLEKKQQIIEKIKAMCDTADAANLSYDEFRALQNEFRETGAVPPQQATEIWKTYQHYVEQFYDQLKMNNEARDYDFRKNLEIKTALCEKAEALAKVEDVIAAFNQLQGLHQEWKECGPVARDLREEIWTRFKDASTVVNKRHQDHFEAIKAKEEENLAKKEELCQFVEDILKKLPDSFATWNEATKEIIAYQAKWRTIGFATSKMQSVIFERFRKACDDFFKAKSEYFKSQNDVQQQNLAAKTSLCELAEELKDSTDWRETSNKMVELQKQWKSIGAVPRKVSDELWTRFQSACDAFFAARKEAEKDIHAVEQAALEAKRAIIEKLREIEVEGGDSIMDRVKDLQKQWNEAGRVPFREKDKIFAAYREVCDKLYEAYGRAKQSRRMEGFRKSIATTAEKGGSALQKERERLVRIRENMKQEIATYENNLGFLSVSSKSKGGNSLVDQMNRKMEQLKGELALMVEKIKTLDAEIKKEN